MNYVSPIRLSVILLVVSWLPYAAYAQEEASEAGKESPWFGSVSFGYLAQTGNAENTNLNSKIRVGYRTGKWQHVADGSAINASENKSTTAENYTANWRSEYKWSEFNFLFAALNYRNNRFSGFPEQFSQSLGYGRRLLNTEAHTLTVDIGAGARQSERSDGETEDDFVIRGGLDYQWEFSETARFSQSLLVEDGQNNTYIKSVSELRAQLIGQLSLVASYTIENNSTVPADRVNTDRFSALSLEYTF